MTRRSTRSFDALVEAQLIHGLTAARRVCISTLTNSPINSPIYRSVGELMDAIDAVAEVATGDRSFLHLKSSSTPGLSLDMAKPRARED